MRLRSLAVTLLLVPVVATPAHAADAVLRTFDDTSLDALDAYGDRVAWTEAGSGATGDLMTLEKGAAVKVDVAAVRQLDVTAGPDGKPVAVYDRCKAGRCQYFLYDFATDRERALKGTPAGKIANWAFWRDRFAVIRDGRLQIVPLRGKAQDIGRAKSLADKPIDFNGAGVSYVNDIQRDEDVEEYQLAYARTQGTGRILFRASHGASGDLSLSGAMLSASRAYVTQRGGEFGGPWRLWRVDLTGGDRRYASLPSNTTTAVPVGAKRAVAEVCPSPYDEDAEDKPCRLVLRTISYRAA